MNRLALLALVLPLGACATDSDSGSDLVDDVNTTASLDTCGGTVEADVPEPFQGWFRCADIAVSGSTVNVHSTGIPPHPSPYFPESSENHVAFDTRGGDWHQNPNELSAQEMTLSLPLDPTPKGITITEAMVDESAGTSTDEYAAEWQGIGLDGTALFTGTAAPGDVIADEEYTFDLWEGHPQNTGVYHHHGANPAALAVLEAVGLVTTTVPGEAEVELYGLMCDGTVVVGCAELDGTAVDAADLDAQNGHVADVVGPDGEVFFAGRYHTHACAALGRTLTPEIRYYSDGC